jgi:streptomycin 6-kinase
VTLIIPERLAATCRTMRERRAWLERLPNAIRELHDRWSLSLAAPFDGNEVSYAWVAPAVRHDGTRAVLNLGMPHMEGEHEIQALRFWDGDPAVRLLEADEDIGAMLLERCEPGTVLRQPPEPESV